MSQGPFLQNINPEVDPLPGFHHNLYFNTYFTQPNVMFSINHNARIVSSLYYSFIATNFPFLSNKQLLYSQILEVHQEDLPGGFLRMNVQSL